MTDQAKSALLREIWLLDDDRGVRFVLAEALRDAGLAVREFGDVAAARAALQTARPALLLTDVRMPGEDGLNLLGELQARGIGPVIVMSAYTDVATTAAAYRSGAVDYLAKPFDLDHAVASVQRALASVAAPTVAGSNVVLANHALLGESAPMREVFRLIGRVAASDLNVLVIGETGTGKELVARALHEESARRDKPFVALNTAAIPGELLESELFGHEAGAFTGATRRVAGRFEQAEGGTLFLDEIGDMPLALQTRLLARAGRRRVLSRRRARADPLQRAHRRRHPPGPRRARRRRPVPRRPDAPARRGAHRTAAAAHPPQRHRRCWRSIFSRPPRAN